MTKHCLNNKLMQNLDREIKEYGENHNVPITKDDTLDFLINLINTNNIKQVLEIGTAIAFGSITMAENTTLEHIDTVENDPERFKIANQNIKKYKLENKISTNLVDALEFLKTTTNKYDLVYLDGPKGQYANYLPYILKLLNVGGFVVADNLYFHGMVMGKIPVTAGCRAMIKGLHKYIAEIVTHPNLETKILDIGDGVGVSKLKNKLKSRC